MTYSAIVGSILGTAVGDALGLPYENTSRRRGARLFGEPTRYRFLFGRGMVSDDTELTCVVAQALIASGGRDDEFARQLGWRFRWWFLGLPVGLGRATLLACLKLWCGFSPNRSGIFSAGNGPAMRSAILGAAIDDWQRLHSLVRISTRITHTDPKAEYGALAIAVAARLARESNSVDGSLYVERVRSLLPPEAEQFLERIERAASSAKRGERTVDFAASQNMGRGVSGYVYHTVPVAVQAWLRYQGDFQTGVMEVIRCGGDTDTTAAIVGGILGAAVGQEGIPATWLDRLSEWPRTVAWMKALGQQLGRTIAADKPERPLRLSAVGLLGRNLLFFLVVLFHILRRCLPPY